MFAIARALVFTITRKKLGKIVVKLHRKQKCLVLEHSYLVRETKPLNAE